MKNVSNNSQVVRMKMRQIRKVIFCVGALLMGLESSVAWAQGTSAIQPVRVGFICPITGGSQDFGNSARLGAELAIKEINEVGGYMGRPFELLVRDDKADPNTGRQVAEDLVLKEKVAFTVGFCNTGVALKALDVFQTNKHLLVIPVSAGIALTTQYPAKESYIFRMSARDTLQASLLVSDIMKRGYTKVAIFADKTGYGEGGLKEVERLLAEKNLKPAYVARFDLGVSNLTQEMNEAKAAGAQVLLGYTVGNEFAVMLQSRAASKFTAPLYGPWTLSFKTVAEKVGSAIDGAIMVQTIIPDLSNERRATFIARLSRFADKQPISSLMAAAQSYDSVHLMSRVVFQAGGTLSGDKLKAALESVRQPYRGVVTTYDNPFSSTDHDAFTRNMVWLGEWRDGKIRFLYPEDAQRSSVIRRKEGKASAVTK
jgi:branched-chain amino acid transport system substrate-binding protein